MFKVSKASLTISIAADAEKSTTVVPAVLLTFFAVSVGAAPAGGEVSLAGVPEVSKVRWMSTCTRETEFAVCTSLNSTGPMACLMPGSAAPASFAPLLLTSKSWRRLFIKASVASAFCFASWAASFTSSLRPCQRPTRKT